MTRLPDIVTVRHRGVRAVNLEEDLGDPDVLTGYVPGAHVVDALRRIAAALQDGSRPRAWSVTGPYGSGKSSFAHLLCALVGGESDAARALAFDTLSQSDGQLAETFDRERSRLGVAERGFVVAAVTADREPVALSLVRALCRGANEFFTGPGRKPQLLARIRGSEAALRDGRQVDVLRLVDELASVAPVLVVIDEFGRNLEHASNGADDLSVLQGLAEMLSARREVAGGVLTLAHTAFEDYLGASGETRRREWRKIHGRFEDLPFVAGPEHSVRLLDAALELNASGSMEKKIRNAAAKAERAVGEIASAPTPSDITGDSLATYPLHPSVVVALPELASRLGQHDRSLVSFLTSDAPHGLQSFLARESVGSQIPFFRAPELFDYFFEDGGATTLTGSDGKAAREINEQVLAARGLEALELEVLKTVALLNLVSGPGRIVANTALVEEAMVGPGGSRQQRLGVGEILERLVDRGLVTYRNFAGEFRVWQGSDFDASGEIEAARVVLQTAPDPEVQLMDTISAARPLRAEVAQRHSQQTHTVRYFEARYSALAPNKGVEAGVLDADGLVLFVLSDSACRNRLPSSTASGLPLITVWSSHRGEVFDAALSFDAAMAVLNGAEELDTDHVARREVRHRADVFRDSLANLLEEAFRFDREGVAVVSEGKRVEVRSRGAFTALLSDVCDRNYVATPLVRNEMVNRRRLTSQGAKARRDLLELALTHEHEPGLALEGFGPERAIYEAVYRHTGLHSEREGGAWSFGPPNRGSGIDDAWMAIEDMLEQATEADLNVSAIYERLSRPPFGMKEGAIPLLVVAALQSHVDDVFIYQDGSFQPRMDAAMVERLVKSPARFSVKRASSIGPRAAVFEELRTTLVENAHAPMGNLRNQTTLRVVTPLVLFARDLPEYAQGTRRVSSEAQKVRDALLQTREPDALLFQELPEACGLKAFSATGVATPGLASEYVQVLRGVTLELRTAYEQLLEDVEGLLRAGFSVVSGAGLREDLRSRSSRLLGQVIEPKMRGFLMTAVDTGLDDRDWLEAMGTTVMGKAPVSWSDRDLALFEALVSERSGWFQRLELLWHEMHADEPLGFDARRVAITSPDGQERVELVAVDSAIAVLAEDALEKALASLDQVSNQQALDALLAAMAERVLSRETATTNEPLTTMRRIEDS